MAGTPRPTFTPTRGSAAIEKEAQKERTDFSATRPTLLKWDGDPSKHTIRLLDDDARPGDKRTNVWIGIARHQYPATTKKPKSFKGQTWPPGMPATCRYAPAFNGAFPNCVPCDNKLETPDGRDAAAKTRVFARAVLRERVLWTGDEPEFIEGTPEYAERTDKWRSRKRGALRGVRDMTTQAPVLDENGKPIKGKTRTVPIIKYIDQSHYLFFQYLVAIAQNRAEDGRGDEDYTVLDRDFIVTRTGEGNKTKYTFEAVPFSEELEGEAGQTVEIDGEVVDLEGVPWDVRDPQVLAYYEQFIPWNLNDMLIDGAMDEHHEKWFVKGGWDDWVTDVEDDDDEDEEDEKPAKKSTQRRGPQVVDDDEDDEEPEDKPAPKARRKPAPAEGDDEDEPEEKPAPKRRRAAAVDEDDEEDDDGPLSRHKAEMRKQLEASEQPARPRRDSSPKDEDDDEDADEDDKAMQKV